MTRSHNKISSIIKCVLLLSVLLPMTAAAQKYEPNTKWPYIYENFEQGTIYFDGNKKSSSELNIHLWGNVLHYVTPDGKIFQSSDKDVVRVEIGTDSYIFSDHKLVRIMSTEGTNLLVELVRGDFDAMRSSGGGAYGSSSNSSATRDLSSLGFSLGGLDFPELGLMLQEKNDGSTIPLVTQYFFIINGQQIDATKKGVEKFMGKEKEDALKQFIKENKIKWKKEDSLKKVLSFLSK